MQENIIGGLISNLIFLLLIIGFGWLVYFFTERRKLLAFFNIKESKRLVIYLSNLRVIRGGSIGADDLPRAYAGTTVVYSEQFTANKFKERFNYLIPSISESPSFLSQILFSDIKVISLPSPLNTNEIEANCSIISFGSPGYNKVSKSIEEYQETKIRFTQDNLAIELENIPPMSDTQNGFIQRVVKNYYGVKRSIFYVAGLSENGTIGAANFLINNWRDLYKKYGHQKSFIIIVSFPTSNYNNYTIVSERLI